MSESRHDSPYANSGLVVTIEPAETGSDHPLAGVHYQRRVERLGFLAGGESHAAPIQWAHDLLKGRASKGALPTSCRRGCRTADLREFLPVAVLSALMSGLPALDRRFGGRFLRDATLTGPESRGSSPVRIVRDPESRQSPGIAGLYPCGEGAGYAGGIISAAVRRPAHGARHCCHACKLIQVMTGPESAFWVGSSPRSSCAGSASRRTA